MLNDRENVLNALREKPLKVREIMRRANIAKERSVPISAIENARRRLGEI
jgi:predicted Zn-ribbon and HTH transcriptional regulator